MRSPSSSSTYSRASNDCGVCSKISDCSERIGLTNSEVGCRVRDSLGKGKSRGREDSKGGNQKGQKGDGKDDGKFRVGGWGGGKGYEKPAGGSCGGGGCGSRGGSGSYASSGGGTKGLAPRDKGVGNGDWYPHDGKGGQ